MGHAYLKFMKNRIDDVISILSLWRHNHFYDLYHLKILTFPILIESSSNCGIGVDFGALASNFN